MASCRRRSGRQTASMQWTLNQIWWPSSTCVGSMSGDFLWSPCCTDGHRLRKGLSCMNPSALRLHLWDLADLSFLAHRVLSWLADLHPEVKRLGKWPALLAEGYKALISEEG